MKKLSSLLIIALLFVTATAQTVSLTFTGRDANNQTVTLDSVIINNLTKGWQETLTAPGDTVLVMQDGTGIDETVDNGVFSLSQNKPNPFNGTTVVNLTITTPGAVTLEISDVLGRIVRTQLFTSLQAGINQFLVTLDATGTYVVTARQNGKISSVKMVCNGTGNANRIDYAGTTVAITPKSHTSCLTDYPFDLGDQMEYTGFATINDVIVESEPVTQAQNASETIVLTFPVYQTDGQPCPGTPTLSDIDGNVYNTVMIGSQCWMKENLKTTKYFDGAQISQGSETSIDVGYWYYPNNESSNILLYGLLYNWKAVMRDSDSSSCNPSGVQGICPTGWHIPSRAEWTQLTDYVGSQSQYVCGNYNRNIAKALADSIGWNNSTVDCAVGNSISDNNATHFSALPSGRYYGQYGFFGSVAHFWTSETPEVNNVYAPVAYHCVFSYDSSYVSTDSATMGQGIGTSVRCVRD